MHCTKINVPVALTTSRSWVQFPKITRSYKIYTLNAKYVDLNKSVWQMQISTATRLHILYIYCFFNK